MFFKLPNYINPNHTVGYYRVSTKKQKYGHSLERYREDLLEYGVLESNLFSDIQSGGEERAGLNNALERLKQLRENNPNKAIALVYPELSRLQRSVLIGEQVKDFLIKHRIFIIEANTGSISDLTSPEGIRDWQQRNSS